MGSPNDARSARPRTTRRPDGIDDRPRALPAGEHPEASSAPPPASSVPASSSLIRPTRSSAIDPSRAASFLLKLPAYNRTSSPLSLLATITMSTRRITSRKFKRSSSGRMTPSNLRSSKPGHDDLARTELPALNGGKAPHHPEARGSPRASHSFLSPAGAVRSFGLHVNGPTRPQTQPHSDKAGRSSRGRPAQSQSRVKGIEPRLVSLVTNSRAPAYPARAPATPVADHAPTLDDVQHCHRVVAGAVLVSELCGSEPIEPFAVSGILS